ncbi:hypothetical protein C8Q74DRAFT_950761 [Fomes fomentarius]|nr:hypothetical protein C8Q74DRAFT_950761 [Fomes fomentarius]
MEATATASINAHLPPEILMKIFTHIHPKDDGEMRYLLVCRRWRELFLHTCEFWVDLLSIPQEFPPDNIPSVARFRRLPALLMRSGGQDGAQGLGLHIIDSDLSKSLARTLSVYRHRLVSLTLQVRCSIPEGEKLLEDLFTGGMMRLEELELIVTSSRRQKRSVAIDFTANAFPYLRLLAIPWDLFSTSFPPEYLTTLAFSTHSGLNRDVLAKQSLSTLFASLGRCDVLAHLRIDVEYISDTDVTSIFFAEQGSRESRITLPRLETLSVRTSGSKQDIATVLIALLDCPSSVILNYHITTIATGAVAFTEAFPPCIAAFPPISTGNALYLDTRRETIEIQMFAEDTLRLAVHTHNDFIDAQNEAAEHGLECLADLCNMFAPFTITSLAIRGDLFHANDLTVLTSKFPKLRRFEVLCAEHCLRQLLAVLDRPALERAWPELEELIVPTTRTVCTTHPSATWPET